MVSLPANRADDFDADVIIIGSGFGGAVSALRLSEKGYRVVVLEAGRRFLPHEFPRSNWRLDQFLWAPKLRWLGIQRLTWLGDVLVLSGAGVGGGSLVYANTLMQPPQSFFNDPRWVGLDDWQTRLQPHYNEALRMLGASASQFLGPADDALRAVADDMGRGDTFHQPAVGVYFGDPGKSAPDPYFGGAGPARTGCTFCGGCMTGCRVGAKNTLDRNYLHLAETHGAVIEPLTTVDDITPIEGGFAVKSHRTGAWWGGRRVFRAGRVIVSAGVLGTVKLLLACRQKGSLPHLSPRLGDFVRTNSETIVGTVNRHSNKDMSRGLAITSGFRPDPDTHIEVVRYGAGHDAMGRLGTLMIDGARGRLHRMVRWIETVARHPLDFLRTLKPWGWAKAATILLVMQPLDNHLRLTLSRGWLGRRLRSHNDTGAQPPGFIPAANLVARQMAKRLNAVPVASINEVFLNAPITAHILGGCTMGRTAEEGVIDRDHNVFGYPGLMICDGAAVPANPGVNPSLTICALTELAMSKIARK